MNKMNTKNISFFYFIDIKLDKDIYNIQAKVYYIKFTISQPFKDRY